MPTPAPDVGSYPRDVLLEAMAVNERMNQIVLDHLDPSLWLARPPGGKGRTIAAIFAHIHNIRRKWLRLSTRHSELPAKLDPMNSTREQTKESLADSARGCSAMIASALTASRDGKFLRDGWARPWPAGVSMVIYMISHDAHHRGQVCMLAHQLGSPLPRLVGGELWNWEKLWRECGFTHPR